MEKVLTRHVTFAILMGCKRDLVGSNYNKQN